MAKITLDDIVSGFKSVSKIIANFGKIETDLNDKVLYRDNPEGEPNRMENLLDMNGYAIINQSNPVTVGGFNWEGDYSGATAYSVGDAVQYSGTAYIAIAESTGQTPPNATYWQIVAEAKLPTQTGNQDKPLTTDGSVASWGSVHADYVDFTSSGAGGSGRTLQDKLEDTVSVKDFGAVGDGVTDDTVAIQAAIDSVNNSGGGIVFVPSNIYRATGIIIKGSVALKGEGKNSTIFKPYQTGYIFKLLSNHSEIHDVGFLHDRSFDCDAIVVESALGPSDPNSINRWNIIRNIHAYKIAGSVIRFNNTAWEQQVVNVMARACGNNVSLKADFHIVSVVTNSDSTNNITFRDCKSIFNHYKGFWAQGDSTLPIRKLRIEDCMFHGGTDENDLTTFPYPQIAFDFVENYWLLNNNLTVGNSTVPNISITGSVGSKAADGTISGNTIASEGTSGTAIMLRSCVETNIGANFYNAYSSGLHLDIDSSNARVYVAKQFIEGNSTFNITNAASDRFGYISSSVVNNPVTVNNETLQTPTLLGVPKINGCVNWSKEAAVSGTATLTVTLPSTEPNTNYHVQVTTNFNCGGAYVTGKTTTSFIVNFPITGTGVAFCLVTR